VKFSNHSTPTGVLSDQVKPLDLVRVLIGTDLLGCGQGSR